MLHESLDRQAYIKTDGKLRSILKVMHISTSGDAKIAVSYSLVVGQIRSDEGHDNHTNGMSPEENMVWGTNRIPTIETWRSNLRMYLIQKFGSGSLLLKSLL